MKTIVAASQKGGSSKSTLVSHLAVEAERAGDGPAWVIDTDRQGTLSVWHERRAAETPFRATLPFAKLLAGLSTLKERGATYLFIDTPPTISDQTPTLLQAADLILIPVRPSPADLWAVGETVSLAGRLGIPFLFVLTQANPRTTITAQAIAALSAHGRVAQSFLSHRVAYAAAMASGRTVSEVMPKGAAADEVAALWAEVKDCFQHGSKRVKSEKRNSPRSNHG